MSSGLANHLTDIAIQYGAISADRREDYVYSYLTFINFAISWAIVFILSAFFGTSKPTLVYTAFFVPLRSFCGGFHASSFARCFSLSIFSYTALCLIYRPAIQLLPTSAMVCCFFFSGLLIAILAPIPDKNKPLSAKRIANCKIITRIIIAIEMPVALIMLFMYGLSEHFYFVLYAFIIISLSLVIAKLRLSS